MSFSLSSQINDLQQPSWIWAPLTGAVMTYFEVINLIGSQKVQTGLFAQRKAKNVIFTFLTDP
jgi:hypothetical protein